LQDIRNGGPMTAAKPAPALLVVLMVSIALPPIGITVIIPSLLDIAREFGTEYGIAAASQTFYLAGLALPQLVYGAVSDRVGRRPTLLTGLGLFTIGSLICLVAPTIELLMAGRMLQAIGGCAGIALGRAILRDLFSRDRAASSLAYMTMAMAVGPSLAPTLGGLAQDAFGWRSIFVALALVSAGIFVLCWRVLPETVVARADRPRWTGFAVGFITLLRDARYRFYAFPPACLSGTHQTILAICSFLVALYFPMPPFMLGLWLLFAITGYIFGNFLSGRFGRRIGIDRMIRLGTLLNLTGILLITAFLATGWMHPAAFFGAMIIINIGHGFALPNGIASATGVIPGLFGSAAGLTGFLQMGLAAICSIGVGLLIERHLWVFPAVTILLALAAIFMAWRAGRE
jgi:DHA1 family bicyclomycin/chloramphenicol resistance-like MFS transporter